MVDQIFRESRPLHHCTTEKQNQMSNVYLAQL